MASFDLSASKPIFVTGLELLKLSMLLRFHSDPDLDELKKRIQRELELREQEASVKPAEQGAEKPAPATKAASVQPLPEKPAQKPAVVAKKPLPLDPAARKLHAAKVILEIDRRYKGLVEFLETPLKNGEYDLELLEGVSDELEDALEDKRVSKGIKKEWLYPLLELVEPSQKPVQPHGKVNWRDYNEYLQPYLEALADATDALVAGNFNYRKVQGFLVEAQKMKKDWAKTNPWVFKGIEEALKSRDLSFDSLNLESEEGLQIFLKAEDHATSKKLKEDGTPIVKDGERANAFLNTLEQSLWDRLNKNDSRFEYVRPKG